MGIQRILVLLIGAAFALVGSIAVAVSIPHVAMIPITGGIAAIFGGFGAMLNRYWSPIFMYFVAITYGVAFVRNAWDLSEVNWFGAGTMAIAVNLASGVFFVAALALSGYVVSLCVKRDTGAT